VSKTNIRKKIAQKVEKPRRKQEPKVIEIQPVEQFNDLCSTCAATPDCANRNPGYPVYHCDEVEMQGSVKAKKVRTAPVIQDPGLKTGLCVNCDNNCSCMNAFPEGGIWNCEEYR